jgi:hypothetical protein
MKIDRKKVYGKYEGHCAYCGCELNIKDMQVDHIKPVYRTMSEQAKESWHITSGTDDIENLNPSCRSCNLRKGTFSVEKFRHALEMCHSRMMRDNANYRQLVRFGQIRLVNNGEITFYFEKNKSLKNV